jgi:hypothetical protein
VKTEEWFTISEPDATKYWHLVQVFSKVLERVANDPTPRDGRSQMAAQDVLRWAKNTYGERL